MARTSRQLVTGETYHLTARGTDRRDIFMDDEDRQRFLVRLGAVVTKRSLSCLSYCLMDNHVHLIVRGGANALSAGMRDLLGGHAQFFNRRHERSGHLFGGRYHHVHIVSDHQLLAAIRYVALNPVHAGLTWQPESWPWSSYGALMEGVVHPGTIDLRALGSAMPTGDKSLVSIRRELVALVEAGLTEARTTALSAA